MTDIQIAPATAEHARTLTDRIKVAVEGTWLLIQEAYMSRAWAALGYSSWDDYCTREFGTSRLRLPREERQEVVSSMREIGMSTRAIGAATGISHTEARRVLGAGGTNVPPRVGQPVPPRHGSEGTPTRTRTSGWDEALRENDIDPDGLDDDDYAAMTGQAETADYGPVPAPDPPRPITGTDGKTYHQPAARPQQKPRTDVVATVSRAIQRAQEAADAADEITRQHLSGRKDEAATWSRSLVKSLESLHGLRIRLEEAQ